MQIPLKGKNLKFVFRLKFILGIMVVCLITLSIISYYSIQEHGKFNDKIYRNTKALFDIEALMSDVLDIETGYRGYLLTKDPLFLVAYKDAKESVNNKFDRIEEDLRGNEVMLEQLTSIERLVDYQLNILSLGNIAKTDDFLLTSRQKSRLEEAKDVVDEIRFQTERMKDYQIKQLGEVRELTKSMLYQNYILIFIFILLIVIILILAYVNITKELERSQSLSNELEQSIHRLSQSNEELEQFAYVASHDLQEPLRKIIAFSDIIKRKYIDILPDNGQDYFDRVIQSTHRLQTLIYDLLNFSRATRNVGGNEKVNLYVLIHKVANDLSEVVKEKKAKLTFRLHKKLFVEGTPVQMRQLFQNLISNALKFSKSGKSPEITISSEIVNAELLEGKLKIITADKYVKITVKDKGIGFKEEYLHKIFTIFQRLHGRSEYSGTGIGLALCKRITENHNGYLTAKSKEGEGSVFLIFLPFYQKVSEHK